MSPTQHSIIKNIKIKSPALTRVDYPMGFMRPSRIFEFLKGVFGELVHCERVKSITQLVKGDWNGILPWMFSSIREGVTLLGNTTVYTHGQY